MVVTIIVDTRFWRKTINLVENVEIIIIIIIKILFASEFSCIKLFFFEAKTSTASEYLTLPAVIDFFLR